MSNLLDKDIDGDMVGEQLPVETQMEIAEDLVNTVSTSLEPFTEEECKCCKKCDCCDFSDPKEDDTNFWSDEVIEEELNEDTEACKPLEACDCAECRAMMECELPEDPWNQMEPPTRSTFPWNENEFAEQLAEAREIFEKKDPFCSCGEDYIHNIMVEEDGNFTIVVLDTDFGPIVGVSKFNPVDVKVIRREDKYGDITYDEKSAFNPETGFRKAVVRAINKLIEKL